MRNLHRSEEHRKRAEALMGLALELGSLVHLPDFNTRSCAVLPTGGPRKAQPWRCSKSGARNRRLARPVWKLARSQPERRLSHALSDRSPAPRAQPQWASRDLLGSPSPPRSVERLHPLR